MGVLMLTGQCSSNQLLVSALNVSKLIITPHVSAQLVLMPLTFSKYRFRQPLFSKHLFSQARFRQARFRQPPFGQPRFRRTGRILTLALAYLRRQSRALLKARFGIQPVWVHPGPTLSNLV